MIGLGFLAARYLRVDSQAVASLLIYIITPVVVAYGVLRAPVSAATITLPIVLFAICSSIGLLTHRIAKTLWSDATPGIVALSAGTGNTGYFGIPVAMALWGESALTPMVVGIMGFVIYENTIGVFLVARGQLTTKDALLKVFRLPTIYAWLCGIVLRMAIGGVPVMLQGTFDSFVGSYTVLGMMLIGLGLSKSDTARFDAKIIGATFAARFLVWPIVMALVLIAEWKFIGYYDGITRQAMLLLSVVPLAANSVAWATHFNVYPNKMATAVLLSTFFALFYIPLVLSLSGYL